MSHHISMEKSSRGSDGKITRLEMMYHWKFGFTRPGKHTINYGKIHHFWMGKSTINGPCSIAMLNYQRVSLSIALSKSSLPEGILSRSFLFEGYQGWYPSDVVCNQLFSEDALGFLVDKALGNIRWLAFKNPTERENMNSLRGYSFL